MRGCPSGGAAWRRGASSSTSTSSSPSPETSGASLRSACLTAPLLLTCRCPSSDREISALAALLPPRPTLDVDLDACQEVSVSDIDMEQEMARERERHAEEEEEDDPRGRVQCAQQ